MRPARPLSAALAALLAAEPARAEPPQAAADEDMDRSSAAFARAEQKLADGDPDGAIALFEAGLETMPTDPGYAPARAQILLTIVDAHEAAFTRDGELERLRRAKRLLDRYLGPLELLDEQGRAAAEARRVRLIDVITAFEDKARAEAAARAAAERRARAERARRLGRTFSISGVGLTGAGVVGVALLGAGLGLGRAADRKIDELKAERLAAGEDWSYPCTDDECRQARRAELDPLVRQGAAGNVLAIVGGVTGGLLLAAGVTLVVLGFKKKREARQIELTPVPTAGRGGLGLTLVGRF